MCTLLTVAKYISLEFLELRLSSLCVTSANPKHGYIFCEVHNTSVIIPIVFLISSFDRPYRRNTPPLEKVSPVMLR